MAIVKSIQAGDYTTIPNSILRSNMSLEAIGLLAILLSNKSDWVVYKSVLCQQIGIGREKLNRIFKELQDSGYIITEKTINQANGQFEYHHVVYDIAFKGVKSEESPYTGLPYTVNPSTVNPSTVNPHLIKNNIINTNTIKEKEIYKEKEKSGSNLAKEEEKSDSNLTKDVEVGETYNDYISYVNRVTRKKFRGDKTSQSYFRSRMKVYTFEDLKRVVDNAAANQYHKDNGYQYLTPEFLLREVKIEKFLNANLKTGWTDEEASRFQRLSQYHQFEGEEWMKQQGLWNEYVSLKNKKLCR